MTSAIASAKHCRARAASGFLTALRRVHPMTQRARHYGIVKLSISEKGTGKNGLDQI